MRNKTCCFTGHRLIPTAEYQEILRVLEETVENLIKQGYCYFGAGGALGFDTMAALTVLKMKQKHPQVRLILVFPCHTQTKGWTKKDIDVYEQIKSKADKVVYTSKEYTLGCMHKRNRYLIDNSSFCIAYLTENKGGTFYTVNYAIKQKVTVINIKTLINDLSVPVQ